MNLSESMSLLAALQLAAVKASKRLDRCLSLHGISFNEFLALHFLSEAHLNTLNRTEIAEYLGITASGATRLLNPMDKNHLVEKQSNPRDARVSLVKLTETGKQVYKDAFTSFQHSAESMLPEARQYQIETVLSFLNKL
ncbi:MAG: hypothetical protein Alis3KO_15270 [Aliiglaciecola sp.]